MAQEAELRDLVQKRGIVKSKVTRFATYMATVSTDNELTQVKLRHEKFATAWDEFDTIQNSIEQLDQTHAALQQEERVTFETGYFAVMTEAERYFQRCAPPVPPVVPPGVPSAPSTVSLTEATAQVKLPTINLPTFNGDYDQWMPFLDTFQSLIHDNNNIAPIQKFHYLRSALTDEAAQVIHSLDISAINYDIAWELLKERFHNKRIIVQNHVKALFDFPAITRESYTTLRQLLDTTSRHLRALKSLELPVESWDTILIHLISSKFDNSTKREWESAIDSKKLPSMDEMKTFLQNRCHLLQSLATPTINARPHPQPQPTGWQRHSERNAGAKGRDRSQSYVSTSKPPCPKCNQPHLIFQCQQFTALTASDRLKEVKRLNLCINCLRADHHVNQCNSGNCRLCARKHNTLLHLSSGERPFLAPGATSHHSSNPVSSGNMVIPTQGATTQQHSLVAISRGDMGAPTQGVTNHPSMVSHGITEHPAQLHPGEGAACLQAQAYTQGARTTEGGFVILSTARLTVYDNHGRPRECRALLDSGSQSSFVTKDLSRRLGLPQQKIHVPVSGINQTISPVTQFVTTKIKSRINNFQAQLSFLILNTITDRLPATRLDRSLLRIPENLILADPSFDMPGPVDMLIGAELFWDLLCVGQIRQSRDLPILQKTQLGWVVSGCINPTQQQQVSKPTACFLSVHQELQTQLQKFWIIEEATPTKHLSPEEESCEAHFVASTRRSVDGRFIVRLPFSGDPSNLGDSRSTAHKRFANLERKFARDPGFREEYIKDINDYLSMGHMQEVSEPEAAHHPVYYLPHHAVQKNQGASNKLRVVFDASAPSINGPSLNDLLMVGPTTDSKQSRLAHLQHLSWQRVACFNWPLKPANPIPISRTSSNGISTSMISLLAQILGRMSPASRQKSPRRSPKRACNSTSGTLLARNYETTTSHVPTDQPPRS